MFKLGRFSKWANIHTQFRRKPEKHPKVTALTEAIHSFSELGWDEEENQTSPRPLVSLARRDSQRMSALLLLSQPELGKKTSENK